MNYFQLITGRFISVIGFFLPPILTIFYLKWQYHIMRNGSEQKKNEAKEYRSPDVVFAAMVTSIVIGFVMVLIGMLIAQPD